MKSWVEISGARLADNLRAVQTVAGTDVEVLAVVKADAYGHGATLCVPVLRDAGAKWLGVTDVAEGIAVRAALEAKPARVVVMCGMELGDASAMVTHELTPVVWTAAHVAALETAGRAAGRRVRVHLEVDTGMGRQGAALGVELRDVAARLVAAEWVVCEGVMTHLCCSEEAGAATTAVAKERFAAALKEVAAAGLRPELVHLGNTSAVDEGGTAEWVRARAADLGARMMVRTGIALYGYCLPVESAGASGQDDKAVVGALRERVRPVMTWRAPVIGVRDVEAGATVGYGATFVARWGMRLALLPVGYADGFRREASSGMGDGWVTICGKLAAVVGRVSMNLTVVDVSGIAGVEVGTEAVLLGEGVSAEDHARWAGTIPYDILCGVRGQRFLR